MERYKKAVGGKGYGVNEASASEEYFQRESANRGTNIHLSQKQASGEVQIDIATFRNMVNIFFFTFFYSLIYKLST